MNRKSKRVHISILLMISLVAVICFIFIGQSTAFSQTPSTNQHQHTTMDKGILNNNQANANSSITPSNTPQVQDKAVTNVDSKALIPSHKNNISLIKSNPVNPFPIANLNKDQNCKKGAPVRQFNIAAIQVDMVYNKFGDHDPNAKIYALREDVEEIRKAIAENPGKPVKEIQPLALRANKGDCIQVTFKNQLSVEDLDSY